MSILVKPMKGSGFTLPELLLLIVVLAIGLTGIVSVYVTAVAGSADPLVQKQSMAIAESFMEEIMLQAYAEPIPPTAAGATRESFDSIVDYDGYSTVGVQAYSGGAVAELANYNVAVAVAAAPTAVNGATAKLVTVTVTGPGGAFALQGYRGNY
jgi:MSHA pilin protein MshD